MTRSRKSDADQDTFLSSERAAPRWVKREERLSYSAPVVVSVGEREVAGELEDVSNGGAFINTHRVVPVDSAVSLELAMPDGEKIHIDGNVVWTRRHIKGAENGVGIRFGELSDLVKNQLSKFLNEIPRPLDDAEPEPDFGFAEE